MSKHSFEYEGASVASVNSQLGLITATCSCTFGRVGAHALGIPIDDDLFAARHTEPLHVPQEGIPH